MYFVFADDVRQKPSRPKMGPLVGAGAVIVDSCQISVLEKSLHQLCVDSGFPTENPKAAEFKWSPGRDLWMKVNLTGAARDEFFLKIFRLLKLSKVQCIVILEDESCGVADRSSTNHEFDVIRLLFERVNLMLESRKETGVVIYDRPGGGRDEENRFLTTAVEMLKEGTRFVKFDRIAFNVFCTQSRFVRLLQTADLVTSCVAARVAGEDKFSPLIFTAILPLLAKNSDRLAGFGLKIHPDYKYANLYHWVLGDTDFWKAKIGVPLPMKARLYLEKPPHYAACEIWAKLIAKVREKRPLIVSWIEPARPHRLERNTLTVLFHPDQGLCLESLSRPNNLRLVTSLLKEITGEDIEINYSLV